MVLQIWIFCNYFFLSESFWFAILFAKVLIYYFWLLLLFFGFRSILCFARCHVLFSILKSVILQLCFPLRAEWISFSVLTTPTPQALTVFIGVASCCMRMRTQICNLCGVRVLTAIAQLREVILPIPQTELLQTAAFPHLPWGLHLPGQIGSCCAGN